MIVEHAQSQFKDTATRRRNRTLPAERGLRFTSWCSGSQSPRPLLDEVGVPRIYDRRRGAWAIPTARLAEVLVYAEQIDRRFVTVQEVAR